MAKNTPIDESKLPPDELEPSTEFAQLVKRVGDRADLGSFGLGAIRQLVRERAGAEKTAPPAQADPEPDPGASDDTA